MVFEELKYSKDKKVVKNKMRELAGLNESNNISIDKIGGIGDRYEEGYGIDKFMEGVYKNGRVAGEKFIKSVIDKLNRGITIYHGMDLQKGLEAFADGKGEKQVVKKLGGGKYLNENIDEEIIGEGVIDIYQKTKNIVKQRLSKLKKLKKFKGLKGEFALQEGVMSDLAVDLQNILTEYNHGLTETELYIKIKNVLRKIFSQKAVNQEKKDVINQVVDTLKEVFVSYPKLKKRILNIEIK